MMTLTAIFGGLAFYAFLQIRVMLDAYAVPSKLSAFQSLTRIVVPGILACVPSVNLLDLTFFQRTEYSNLQLLSDPRLAVDPYMPTNVPNQNGNPYLLDCCLTNNQDFFVSCFTLGLKCPTPVRFRRGLTSKYQNWQLSLDCADISPGLVFRSNSDNLWLPLYLLTDNGIGAYDQFGNFSRDAPNMDRAWLKYMDNNAYIPAKIFVFTYIEAENNTNLVDVYFGKHDDNVGGSQGRIRCDVGRGISSLWWFHFTYTDVNKQLIPAYSGLSLFYEAMIESVPWNSSPSLYPAATVGRLYYQELGWLKVHINMDETQITERVSFSYLDLSTTFLSIIGASTALIKIIVGPGEFDPKGMLNKCFYMDVPTMKETNTDGPVISGDTGNSL